MATEVLPSVVHESSEPRSLAAVIFPAALSLPPAPHYQNLGYGIPLSTDGKTGHTADMSGIKNQHTVTKAYLRRFADPSAPNSLWRFDKTNGSCEIKSVEKATVKFWAYSFLDSNGQWNDSVERLLSTIESDALPLLPKLEAGNQMTADERFDLSLFFAAMIRRPAALIDHLSEQFLKHRNDKKRLLSFFESLLPELQLKFSQSQIDEARQQIVAGEFNASEHTAKKGQLRAWIEHLPNYSQIIANMHWEIWTAAAGHCFVTSDAPAFVRRHAHDEDLGVVGINRADLNAELTIPLSRTRLLLAKHKPSKPTRRATKTRVRELNALIVRMAHRYVFSHENSSSIGRLVQENMTFKAPLPNLDEYNAKHDVKFGLHPDS